MVGWGGGGGGSGGMVRVWGNIEHVEHSLQNITEATCKVSTIHVLQVHELITSFSWITEVYS